MSALVTTTTTITPRFQVHIPVAIRKAIGLKTHGRAIVEAKKDTIIIKPVRKKDKILSLAGKYKNVKPIKQVDINKIREMIDYSQV